MCSDNRQATWSLQACVNMALAIQMASIAEAMSFGASLGLEAKALAGILNASSSRCWSSSHYNPVPVSSPSVNRPSFKPSCLYMSNYNSKHSSTWISFKIEVQYCIIANFNCLISCSLITALQYACSAICLFVDVASHKAGWCLVGNNGGGASLSRLQGGLQM